MGKHSAGGQLSMSGDRVRAGTRVSGAVSEQLSYSASVSAQPRGFGASFAPRAVTYSATARGGIAFHRHGLTFSPYPVRDTFGVVSVGDLAGVRVVTPDGPVWTDRSGRAVVPSLSAFSRSQVEVAATSLPRDVDIDNGVRHLTAARGAVRHVEFGVTRVRRVLLDVKMPDGTPVRRGSTVVDDSGKLVTIVADEGRLFLDDARPGAALRVALGGGKYCALDYALSGERSAERYYETTQARCVPQ
jgi:outer membrane usher protein FimD/PapC